jgi:osmotically inducible protein OsmC
VRLRSVDGVPTIDLVELDTTVDVDGGDTDALDLPAPRCQTGTRVGGNRRHSCSVSISPDAE